MKAHLFGVDTVIPEINRKETTVKIMLYLYSEGKYEAWCQKWKKNPENYWFEVHNLSYSDYRQKNPTVQLSIRQTQSLRQGQIIGSATKGLRNWTLYLLPNIFKIIQRRMHLRQESKNIINKRLPCI